MQDLGVGGHGVAAGPGALVGISPGDAHTLGEDVGLTGEFLRRKVGQMQLDS